MFLHVLFFFFAVTVLLHACPSGGQVPLSPACAYSLPGIGMTSVRFCCYVCILLLPWHCMSIDEFALVLFEMESNMLGPRNANVIKLKLE